MNDRGSVLITGGDGRLAATVAPAFDRLGWEVFCFGRELLDVTDRELIVDCVRATGANVVLNLAAWTDVEGCEREPERAERINARAVGHLRDATALLGAHLVHISSDYVFDGQATEPYTEGDDADPVNAYGVTKLLSEREAGPDATVLRTSWISGRFGRCLVRAALDSAVEPGHAPRFVADQFGSPTNADDLVEVLDHVARHRVAGLLHVAGTGVATPHAIAHHVFEEAGSDPDRVVAISSADRLTARSARRPLYSALDSGAIRAAGIPSPGDWRESMSRLVAQLLAQQPA